MKIIKRVEEVDHVLGRVTCKRCTSELEITIADLYAGTRRDYSGKGSLYAGTRRDDYSSKSSYVAFTCPVCACSQDTNLATWDAVNKFHERKHIDDK